MHWSFPIGRVAGTEIKVHVTFLLLLGLFFLGGGLSTVVLILAIFACIVLHEFGHIMMARRFGVRTPDVILLPIGGVARLERIPEVPLQEFLIALAGPAVTLAIAVVLYGALLAAGAGPPLGSLVRTTPLGFWGEICRLNVWLLLFNLIPAFPMDGGRVLRSLLSARLGFVRATRTAAQIGQALAFVMGFVAIARTDILLAIVAFFIFLGAGAESAAVEVRAAGKGIFARDMMVTEFHALPVHATLGHAAELLLAGEQREFPVVDNWGTLEGLLTRDDLIRGLTARGPGAIVSEAMTAGVAGVAPDLPFAEALERLGASRLPALPVVEGGRLVGLITRDNITDLLLIRRAQRSQPPSAPGKV